MRNVSLKLRARAQQIVHHLLSLMYGFEANWLDDTFENAVKPVIIPIEKQTRQNKQTRTSGGLFIAAKRPKVCCL